jgi:hypothetical protein
VKKLAWRNRGKLLNYQSALPVSGPIFDLDSPNYQAEMLSFRLRHYVTTIFIIIAINLIYYYEHHDYFYCCIALEYL